jgi:hypothetical protein
MCFVFGLDGRGIDAEDDADWNPGRRITSLSGSGSW